MVHIILTRGADDANRASLKVMLIVLRVGYGTAQAFVMCHVPMWIRRTAPRENRASWIGLYQAAIPMGVLVGYLLAALILCFKTTWIYAHTENWRMIFLIQVGRGGLACV